MDIDETGKVWTRPNSKQLFITIPRDLAVQKAFPFEPGDEVEILIDIENKRLIIQKPKKENTS